MSWFVPLGVHVPQVGNHCHRGAKTSRCFGKSCTFRLQREWIWLLPEEPRWWLAQRSTTWPIRSPHKSPAAKPKEGSVQLTPDLFTLNMANVTSTKTHSNIHSWTLFTTECHPPYTSVAKAQVFEMPYSLVSFSFNLLLEFLQLYSFQYNCLLITSQN